MGFKQYTILNIFFYFHISLLCCYEEDDKMPGGLDIYWLEQLHRFIYSVYYYC